MPILARRRVPLLVHAEAPEVIELAAAPPVGSRGVYRYYLSTRPVEAEVRAIALMIGLAREFGAHVHIVHVACAEGADAIARAKSEGVPITGETCPHYLVFEAEEIPDGATEFKCAPPIRERRHREVLWRALESGTLDLVATDHSPAPPSMKPQGDFLSAWGGIASLEVSLAAVYSMFNVQGSTFGRIAEWMSAAPAQLAGIDSVKGRIAPGYDADLVVWDPDVDWTVDAAALQQRHKLTPYAGRALRGKVETTFLRGERVWHDGRLVAERRGQFL
jgi:allantoinase